MKITGQETYIRFEAETPAEQIELRHFGAKFREYCGSWINEGTDAMGIEVSTQKLFELVNASNPGKHVEYNFVLCRAKNGTLTQVDLKDGETAQGAYDRFHAADITQGPKQGFYLTIAEMEARSPGFQSDDYFCNVGKESHA